MATRPSLEQRFWSNVDKRGPDECWPWTAHVNRKGYGRITADGRSRPAPQVAWSLANRCTFPVGLLACHSCDNPSCVNPAHIWPGTPSQNMLDAVRKGRWKGSRQGQRHTSFPRFPRVRQLPACGHDPDHFFLDCNGSHRCRVCARATERRYRERTKAAAI